MAEPGNIQVRLASSHDALDAGLRLPCLFARELVGGPKHDGLRQSEQKESIRHCMIETVAFVAMSVQELRRLITHLQRRRPVGMRFHWHWSFWRRHHQAEAKRAHYRKRGANLRRTKLQL
jgi:hypothetical protein